MNPKILLAAIMSFAGGITLIGADAPRLLPFQGRLSDSTGIAVANRTRVVQFKIYDAPVGGQAIWNGEVHKLTVNDGLVNTVLGSKSSLAAVDFNQALYLELTVDANNDNQIMAADPPLLPRQSIVPAVFAKEAADSRTLDGHDWSSLFAQGSGNPATALIAADRIVPSSIKAAQIAPQTITAAQIANATITGAQLAQGTFGASQLAPESIDVTRLAKAVAEALNPPGTIQAFAGPNVPPGWLLCDGSALDKDNPAYQRLWATIQTSWGNGSESGNGAQFPFVPGVTDFNVPDLRGMFLRGVSGVSTNDPDRTIRIPTMIGGNTGNLVGSKQPDDLRAHQHTYLDRFVGGNGSGIESGNSFPRPDQSRLTDFTGGNETRPINVYVHYIIKY